MAWLSSIRDAIQRRLETPPQTDALAQGLGVVAADAAPAESPPAVVDSPEALQLAMRWLRWLKSRSDTLDAIHKQTLALVEEGTRREKELPTLGTTIPDLFARLETAVLGYAEAEAPTLFADGQTHRVAGGAVKRSKAPLKIELDGDAKQVELHLAKTLRLDELLSDLTTVNPELAIVAQLTRVRCEPNKQAAADAFKNQRLTADQLALAKMQPAPPSHSYKIEL